jgi:hypothetical protein
MISDFLGFLLDVINDLKNIRINQDVKESYLFEMLKTIMKVIFRKKGER